MQLSAGPPWGMSDYLPPVEALILLDEDSDEVLNGQIMSQGRVLAPDLIRLAFDEDLSETLGPVHAVSLLRRLQADMAVELTELAPWLERARGNWQRELLTNNVRKIGGYTTDELVEIAADTTYDLYTRTGMTNALVDPTIVSLQDLQEEWGMPVSPQPARSQDGITAIGGSKRTIPHTGGRIGLAARAYCTIIVCC